VKQLMALSPEERPTAEKALRHPWLLRFSKDAREYADSHPIEQSKISDAITPVTESDNMTNLCTVWEDSKDMSATERFRGAVKKITHLNRLASLKKQHENKENETQ
jgi:hypothetical protein